MTVITECGECTVDVRIPGGHLRRTCHADARIPTRGTWLRHIEGKLDTVPYRFTQTRMRNAPQVTRTYFEYDGQVYFFVCETFIPDGVEVLTL